MPAPKKTVNPAAAEVAALEAQKAAIDQQERTLKQAAPKLNPDTAKRVPTPYRHAGTAQTVYFLDQGWCFTATGIPIAPAPAAAVPATPPPAPNPPAPPAAE